jgi:NAD(P)-dependent dehydrogenase (short-subunit alcohol dehydrogenase family)
MSASLKDLLAGKRALVTGAGQGNGRAIALGLASHGADIVAADIDLAGAERTAADLRGSGADAFSFRLDVTDAAACHALAQAIAQDIGEIDILINNAGIIIREGLDSPRAAENWRRVLDVNLTGVFNVTHAFLATLRKTRGTIVNLGSIASFVGVGDTLGYAPSKGGVKLLTQALARDLARDGIRVNAIAPGVIETAMTEVTRNDPARLADFVGRTPLGRVGQPEELVGPVVFLVSEMASYVSGVTLPVDGGFLAVEVRTVRCGGTRACMEVNAHLKESHDQDEPRHPVDRSGRRTAEGTGAKRRADDVARSCARGWHGTGQGASLSRKLRPDRADRAGRSQRAL